MSTTYPEAAAIDAILRDAKRVVILQADNPDGDSLASSLALEEILGAMGKEPFMYCGVDVPSYLRYLPGWDRVSSELPSNFDAAIIVDASSESLFEQLVKHGKRGIVASKPTIILDHHPVEATITFAKVICNQKAVATGEVIYELAQQLSWELNQPARNMIAVSILSDSLGLMSEGTSPRSIHIIGELAEQGVSLAELENRRRETMRKTPELLKYKGALLQRVEFHDNNRVATITIPWKEIETYSTAYNPSMLVIDDMRLIEGTAIAIAFKVYSDGKVTAKIRCNFGKGIGNALAQNFGGGGHPYASGFKIVDGRPFDQIKAECIKLASELLDKLEQESNDETV